MLKLIRVKIAFVEADVLKKKYGPPARVGPMFTVLVAQIGATRKPMRL
jgi:hypothetical protein